MRSIAAACMFALAACDNAPSLQLAGAASLNVGSDSSDIEVASAQNLNATPLVSAAQSVAEQRPRGGLLGGIFGGGPSQPNALGDMSDGLSYGEVVADCNVPRGELGQEVARFPENGRGYRLFDSNPSTINLRAHYILGFRDGCPRKFLAALAIFGGPGAYETTRYEDGRNSTIVTETDTRYKAIRARVCGAPVGQACSDRRFGQLERRAVFVSVYERFGTNPTWADMLIYDGEVVAKDFKAIR